MSQRDRRLRNFVLDARYQLRFAGFLVLVCGVLMTGLGWFVVRRVESATKAGINNIQAQREIIPDAATKIQSLVDREVLIGRVLVGTGVGLCVFLFFYGIRMTHRVAGPLHKVTVVLEHLRDGRFEELRPLRKGDSLQEFYDHFCDAYEAVRKREATEIQTMKAALAALEHQGEQPAGSDLQVQTQALASVVRDKEGRLG